MANDSKTKKQKLWEIWEKEGKKKFNKDEIAQIAKQLETDTSSVYKYLRDFRGEEVKPKIKKPKSGGGIEKFREIFDDSLIVPKKIEEGIKKHLINSRGEPDWMYDRDFREACGVSVSKWRRYADDFKHLQVKKDGLIIWGHPDIIEEMRRVIQL